MGVTVGVAAAACWWPRPLPSASLAAEGRGGGGASGATMSSPEVEIGRVWRQP